MDFERLPVLKRTKHSSTVYPTQVQMAPSCRRPPRYPAPVSGRYTGAAGGGGYAVTPKTGRPAYIKTPLLPGRLAGYGELLRKLKKRGTNPYGEGR